MAYIDVISLERAKNYLRVDPDFTEDDEEITSMISAALRYIEKRTNHIMYARDITYRGNCQVKTYDYPINSIVTDPPPFICYFATYVVWPDAKEVTANVGYASAADVPDDLIQAALQMIKVWYYESEKQVNTTLIPESVNEVLSVYQRFLL
jgi:hypothetical protein